MSVTEEAVNCPVTETILASLKNTDNTAEKQKVHSLKSPTYESCFFYEKMINDFKSDIAFLREQLVQRDNYFREDKSFYATKLAVFKRNNRCVRRLVVSLMEKRLIWKIVNQILHHQISREIQV